MSERELEISQKVEDEEHLLNYLQDIRDNSLHNSYTCLLALKGKEWASGLIGDHHPLSQDFRNMSQKIQAFFLYKGQDENNIFFEHIATSKEFKLTKKSFDHGEVLTKIDTIVSIGLVNWRGEWWFSGVYFQKEYNPELINTEKNSMQSRMIVDKLEERKSRSEQLLEEYFKVFKELTNGRQVVFFEADKIEPFILEYLRTLNKYRKDLAIKSGKKKKSDLGKKELEPKADIPRFSEISDTGLIFFNPRSGLEVAMGVNSAFPTEDNPFFNSSESKEDILNLIFDDSFSPELVKYCFDHFKSDLSFFESVEGKFYLENPDFLFRFLKRSRYYSQPEISFI
ncbi:MAG: DUF3843 family protein [Bacteroidales bacterium]